MSDKLLPCPFCGSEPELHTNGKLYWVECHPCGLIPYIERPSADIVVAQWNRRAQLAVPPTIQQTLMAALGVMRDECGAANDIDVALAWLRKQAQTKGASQ